MIRELRLSANTNGNLLTGNPRHAFAARHALSLFGSRSVYSYIPKNACTTLRFSLAIANGCLRPEDDPAWVDANNATFVAGLPALLTADYTFIVLRCPYRRLASAYLDKLTQDTGWRRRFLEILGEPDAALSFRSFVKLIQRRGLRRSDHHWAPQVDFMVYRQYDDVFRLEDYETMRDALAERIGLVLYDTRSRVPHGLDRFEPVEGAFADVPALTIGQLQSEGRSPGHAALYDDEVRALVDKAYAKDLDYYRHRFGGDRLLFDG